MKIKVLHNITDKETGEAMFAGVTYDVDWDKSRVEAAVSRELIRVVSRSRGRKSKDEKEDVTDNLPAIPDQAG